MSNNISLGGNIFIVLLNRQTVNLEEHIKYRLSIWVHMQYFPRPNILFTISEIYY